MVTLPTFDATSSQPIIEALEHAGAAIVTGVATPAQVAAIRAELQPHIDREDFGIEEYGGLQTRRIGLLVKSSPTFRDILLAPSLTEAAGHFLGGPKGFQLCGTMGIDIGPESRAQPLHTDETEEFPSPRPSPVLVVNLMAIDAFTRENGATLVIPGSHKWPIERRPTDADAIVSAVMSPGAVCIVLGTTWHAGGANRTTENRFGVRFSYCPSWFRQEENQYLAVPPSLVETLSNELRGLLGYRVAKGLGVVFHDKVNDEDVMKRLFAEEAPPLFIVEALERAKARRGSAGSGEQK